MTSIPLLVAVGVRRDGQKVLLAVKNMGGETEAAWRHVLEDLLARGLKAPELLIVDGGKGLEAALASLWSDIPVQRCTVHKERNLLAHAPKELHDEVKADFTDMMYGRGRRGRAQEAQGLPGQVAAPLPGRGGQPGRGRRAAVHLLALSAAAMEVLADHQRHRTPIGRMSADVAGYSRLMGTDETGTLSALKALRKDGWQASLHSLGRRALSQAA